jgi:hypothetical protein
MKKYEFYNMLLKLYASSGQGLDRNLLSRIKDMSCVDELVAEGKVIITHESMRYSSDEDWIQPVGFYNTEAECVKSGSFKPLFFIRKYLNIDQSKEHNINQTTKVIDADPELLSEYSVWVDTNRELLENIKNIDKYFIPLSTDQQVKPVITGKIKKTRKKLTSKHINIITKQKSFESNPILQTFISNLLNSNINKNKQIEVHEKLIPLYKDTNRHAELEESEKSIIKLKKQIISRKNIIRILSSVEDKSIPIKEYLSSIL